jgi:lipid II:glycine glycyltransferase (peptidoglycan interpeptide bridge formation enzyme)
LQTRQWGQLKNTHGWRAAHASIATAQGRLAGTSLLLLRALPFGLGNLAYVPRGPVVDWDRPELMEPILNATCRQANRNRAMAVVIEPDLFDTPSDRALLQKHGFVELDFTIQPPRTILINLDVDEDVDILAAMKQKTRYNVGLAKRKGVAVRTGSLSDVATFHTMMEATTERKSFGAHGLGYYQDFYRLFTSKDKDETTRLFLAEFEGEPLAGLMATAVGKTAIYLYGASTNHKRELMAPYLLQWEAMQWARAKGCVTYDMWGVPDEDEATLEANFEQRDGIRDGIRNDGLWGVYRFKRGFGGQVVRHIGAWVKVLSPLRWRLYGLARKLRKTTGLGG